MNQLSNFCDIADFYFIVEYLAHNEININYCDDVDLLYQDCKEVYCSFVLSEHYNKSTSYMQAIKDFLQNNN